MKNHYIPRLLLKHFAEKDKVNIYDFKEEAFATKKLRDVFALQDIFEPELEYAFATKLEGPFGDLLHHKLLSGETISIDRKENLLMRKFLMIQFLRAPIVNTTWDEMVERTRLKEHPSVQAKEFLERHHPELKELFNRTMPSKETYLSDLKKVMEVTSLEEIVNPANPYHVSVTLQLAASHAMASVIAFWDCTKAEQEFILPKLPGISQMDQVSVFHKSMILRQIQEKHTEFTEVQKRELDRLIYGSFMFTENFKVYPLSTTRAIICFSPYFRAFFPSYDETGEHEIGRPFLQEEQFEKHFYRPMRMELFTPCKCIANQYYEYKVKQLQLEDILELNAMMLDMETEEFVFHDFNRIRDAFWYYDKKTQIAYGKKHDFSQWE